VRLFVTKLRKVDYGSESVNDCFFINRSLFCKVTSKTVIVSCSFFVF